MLGVLEPRGAAPVLVESPGEAERLEGGGSQAAMARWEEESGEEVVGADPEHRRPAEAGRPAASAPTWAARRSSTAWLTTRVRTVAWTDVAPGPLEECPGLVLGRRPAARWRLRRR